MNKFFLSLYDFFVERKKLLISILILLMAGLTFSFLNLNYKEDIADFLPNNEANKQINAVYQHIGSSDKLMINFSMSDTSLHNEVRIMEAIDQFATRLIEKDSLHQIPEIISQVDETQFLDLIEFIQQNVPYFLTKEDYAIMDSLLQKENYIASQIEEDKRLLMLPSGSMMRNAIVSDPLHLFTPLLLKLQDFQVGNSHEVNNGYLFSNNGRKGLVIITSPYGVSETAHNSELLALINQTIEETHNDFPELKITCFGAPAIAVTNASQIKNDSILSISLAVILILALLIYSFRNARNLFLIFFSILFGWLFALGTLALFKDSISAIALGISSIFIGIAINYPLHFVDHLKHELNRKQALKEIIPPLLIGNITTVGAFLSLAFINSPAMRDLGLFGSLLLIGTIIFVLVFLPHLIRKENGTQSTEHAEKNTEHRTRSMKRVSPKWRPIFIALFCLLTVLFLFLSQFTEFEPNMNVINYMTDQQHEDMQDMMQQMEKKDKDIVYFVAEGKTLEEALSTYENHLQLLDSLKHIGFVESISGIGTFLPSQKQQQQRIDDWNQFWSSRNELLTIQLKKEAELHGFNETAFDDFLYSLISEYQPQEMGYFNPISSLLADNYLIKEQDNILVVNILYCNKGSLEQVEQIINNNISTQQADHVFSFDSRNMGQRMVDALSDDFNYVLYICGFIVFIFLSISFGRLELSFMAFLPLAVGWVWILGLMQIADIRFNIVNIILATFIFGQGDDYTIFITEGLIYEYTYGKKMLASYKKSITLSALIMFAGIGTLIFAKHPALRSLAQVTIVGMFSVVMMAYVIPPFVFKFLTHNKYGIRAIPWTFKRFLYSLFSFLVFLILSSAITVVGFLFFGFRKKSKVSEKRKLMYHNLLHKVAIFVINLVPGTNVKYENNTGENFEKPAVIVSNHQSHLDIMCILMLSPKIILLTNDWVKHSPFFGILIKYANFYPVSNGIENNIDQLAQKVKEGFSIAVFPEGTRSPDCSILRFHKGAFYLAHTLKLDIIPVMLHGIGYVLPKKDFLLREGEMTVKVFPRITPGNILYANDYQTCTKLMRCHYKETFAQISKENETTSYFKFYVLHNYLYKGKEIWNGARKEYKNLKKSLRLNEINHFKGSGTVCITNNGYGIYSFLFAMVHPNITIIATEQDTDKVAIAKHCAGLPPNITIYSACELPNNLIFDHTIDL